MEPLWPRDKGLWSFLSTDAPFSALATMGMRAWEAGETDPVSPPMGLGAYISPLDDRISITLKGSSIYAAIF